MSITETQIKIRSKTEKQTQNKDPKMLKIPNNKTPEGRKDQQTIATSSTKSPFHSDPGSS